MCGGTMGSLVKKEWRGWKSFKGVWGEHTRMVNVWWRGLECLVKQGDWTYKKKSRILIELSY
jgi:acyl-coenzyme A synthetase/AMP-(fatty) acid ligase